MTETIVYILILIAGIFLMIYRPLAKRADISPYWEVGIGAATIILFIIFIYSSYITPQRIIEDLAKAPCGSDTPQGYCYSLERKVCETMWEKATEDCKVEMADWLNARPTGLIGPALNRCKAKKMDKVVHFNRLHTDTAYCRAYFEYLAKP
jgi:hypothetical protein